MKNKPHNPTAFFQNILELIDSAVLVIDPEENSIEFINQKFWQISGFSTTEPSLVEISSITTSRTILALKEAFKNLKNSGNNNSISIDGTILCKSGKSIDGKWNIRLLSDVDTQYVLITISENKPVSNAANTPKYGLNPYQKLLNYVNIGIFQIDLMGRFLFVNFEMSKITGFYSIDELLTIPFNKIYYDFDQGINILNLLSLKDEIRNIEIKANKKDGTCYWVSMNAVFIKDNKGNPETILGFVKDITEQKRFEENLKTNRANLQAIIDNFPFLAWLKDAQGRFIAVNIPFVKASNLASAAELIGKTDSEVWPQKLAEGYLADDLEVMTSGKNKNIEELISVQGTEKWFETFKSPLFDIHGSVIGTTGFSRDITERKMTEEAIRDSEKRFRALLENSADAITCISAEGKVIYESPNVTRITGYDIESRMGKSGFDTILPDDMPHINETFECVLSKPGIVINDIQFRAVRKDGSIYWAVATATNMLNDPYVQAIVVNYHDITARKQFELKINQSEKKFSAAFLKSPVALAISTVSEGTYIDVNDSFLKLLGYSYDEVIGKTSLELNIWTSNEERAKTIDFIQKNGSLQNLELKIKDKNNKILTTIFSVEYIEIDNKQCLLTSALDITDRKNAELVLKDSESYLQKAFEIAAIGQWQYDIIHDCYLWTESSIGVIGFRPDAIPVTYLDYMKFLHPDDLEGIMAEIEKSHTTHKFEFEHRLIVDGNVKWVRVKSHTELDENGTETFAIGIIQDITKRKNDEVALNNQNQEYLALNEEYLAQNEELIESLDRIQKINHEYELAKKKAQESDKLKSAFLANMSHEIRTPMNGIIGFTELLREPELTGAQQQRYIGVIQKSGQRMLNIINDLIDISKIEAGQIELVLEKTNINLVFDNLYAFFKPESDTKGFKFSYKKGLSDSECFIITDENKIIQILTNLIKNALRYTTVGFIEFGYTLEKSADATKNNQLKFYVKDSGIGIKPEIKDKIFERFHQGDLSYSKTIEGAGLGLSISKAFIEMLGGEIWVESKPDKGSIFYFNLPFITSKDDVKSQKFTEKSTDIAFAEKTLLIAEDDKISFLYLKEIFDGQGFNLLHAENGMEAIRLVRTNPDIKLVLMDIKMPDMNGFEATKIIKQLRPQLPVIAQTAFASPHDEQKCYNVGCNDYISKPVKPDILLQKVLKYFQ